MTSKDGKPCNRCGTSAWYRSGLCRECTKKQANGWYATNRAKALDRLKRWYETSPEVAKQRTGDYISRNPHKRRVYNARRRTRVLGSGKTYTYNEWKGLCDHYGNKCLCCGREGVPLAADHIRPISKGGSSTIDNIQPLCKSCNSSKCDKHIDYRPDAGPLRWLQRKLFG